jgi:hypothetical protein
MSNNNKLPTFTGYLHTVEGPTDPYYEVVLSINQDEILISVDKFINDMRMHSPELCSQLEDSTVTNVLVMRGW